MDVKIASFNVNGLVNPTKRKAIFDYLRTIPATIFLLQETHSIVQLNKPGQTNGNSVSRSFTLPMKTNISQALQP